MSEKIEIIAELKDLMSGHMKEITAEVNRLDGALANVGRNNSGGGGSGKGLMGSVLGANLLTSAISMGTSAIKDFAVSSVDAFMKNEMYEARLTTLLHGRKEALFALNQITTDAAKTPFDKESLVQGNSMLIGAGVSATSARKSIMDLGNAIAATGGGSDELKRMSVNLAQIKSIGKASALDVKQFMYANIPIYDMLAKSMHKNADEIKGMEISYKDLTKALADARVEGGMFYEGLENANKTLSGQVSNLGDAWDQLKVNIAGSQEGILKSTVTWASGMVSQLNRAMSNENQKQDSYNKYGAKEYSFGERYSQGQLIAGLFGKSKVQEDTKYQDALNKNYVDKAGNSALDAANSMRALSQLIANNTGASSLSEKGDFEYKQDLAILKGTLDRVKDLYNGFKKKNPEEAAAAAKIAAEAVQKNASLEKVAKGNRPTQVNVNIENLVREYKPQVNNDGKAIYKVTQEDVSKALIAAVNDISVMQFGE